MYEDWIHIRVFAAAILTWVGIVAVVAIDGVSWACAKAGFHGYAAGVGSAVGAIGSAAGFAWARAFERARGAISLRVGQYRALS